MAAASTMKLICKWLSVFPFCIVCFTFYLFNFGMTTRNHSKPWRNWFHSFRTWNHLGFIWIWVRIYLSWSMEHGWNIISEIWRILWANRGFRFDTFAKPRGLTLSAQRILRKQKSCLIELSTTEWANDWRCRPEIISNRIRFWSKPLVS